MKPSALIRVGMASMLFLGFLTSLLYYSEMNNKSKVVLVEELYNTAVYDEEVVSLDLTNEVTNEEVVNVVKEEERVEVYDNLTMEELTDKLNRILSSSLENKGDIYAKYSIELGVDPYLAVAISMHETGCTWDCSYLAKACNNVGGQKGYGCGEYQAFDTLEDGIYGFILNIKNKYVDYGLMTADEMNPKYAEDPNWSSKVNKYIEKIKNS